MTGGLKTGMVVIGESKSSEVWESPFAGSVPSMTKLELVTGGLGLEALLLGNSSREAKGNGRSDGGIFDGATEGEVTSLSLMDGLVNGGRKVVIRGPGGWIFDEVKALIPLRLKLSGRFLKSTTEDLGKGGGVRTEERLTGLDPTESESVRG